MTHLILTWKKRDLQIPFKYECICRGHPMTTTHSIYWPVFCLFFMQSKLKHIAPPVFKRKLCAQMVSAGGQWEANPGSYSSPRRICPGSSMLWYESFAVIFQYIWFRLLKKWQLSLDFWIIFCWTIFTSTDFSTSIYDSDKIYYKNKSY